MQRVAMLFLISMTLAACFSRKPSAEAHPEEADLTPQESTTGLDARIIEAVRTHEDTLDCRIGFSLLASSGERVEYRAGELFHAASTMKVPVMIEVYRQMDQGRFDEDNTLIVETSFPSLIDGSMYDVEPDPYLKERIGQPVSFQKLVEEMIQVSDNVATNLLIRQCGSQRITATMRSLGAEKGYVIRGLMDEPSYQAGISNRLTPNDLTALMRAIDTNEAASPESCETMFEVLAGQKYLDMIPAGVPEGVPTGNKTGSITGVRHDTAIVRAPFGHYYLTILMDGLEDGDAGKKAAADLSRLVYEELSALQ